MGENPLALDDISKLWPSGDEDAVSLVFSSPTCGTRDARERPARPGSGGSRSERGASDARLERAVAQLSYRLDALAREVAVLAAATKVQGDRLAALEQSVRESMLLLAAAIDRPARR